MRRTLLVIPVFFTVGFVFLTAPAHAAGSVDILPGKDVVVLKQALDLLQTVLNQLSARFDSGDPVVLAKTGEINASLSDIRGNLFSLDGTLAAFKDASRAVAEEPASEGNSVAYNVPEAAEAVAAPLKVANSFQGLAQVPGSISNNDQVAAVSSHFYSNRFVWPGMALVVAFAGIWFFRMRNKNRALASAGSRKNTQPTQGRATV